MLDQYFVCPSTLCTPVLSFLFVEAIERQVTEEECNFPSVVAIDVQKIMTRAVDLRDDCSEVFVISESNEPQINNNNIFCQ